MRESPVIGYLFLTFLTFLTFKNWSMEISFKEGGGGERNFPWSKFAQKGLPGWEGRENLY